MDYNYKEEHDASAGNSCHARRRSVDVRSYSERFGDTALQRQAVQAAAAHHAVQREVASTLNLRHMAAAETGDPYLDHMARAVAINHLRQETLS